MTGLDRLVRWHDVNVQGWPLCMSPAYDGGVRLRDLVDVIGLHRQELRDRLARAGAILLRDYDVRSAEDFAVLVEALVIERARYRGGDARRTLVSDFVYTANDKSQTRSISPHNEMGYSRAFPQVLLFYCRTAAATGGETPLTDGRHLLRTLSSELLEQFRAADVVYIQNLPDVDDFGVESAKSWRKTFETADRGEIDRILAARGAKWWWTKNDSLHVEETVPAFVVNSLTGEEAFFCQADRWHVSQGDAEERMKIGRIPSRKRYHHCLFSNGVEMSEDFLAQMAQKKIELSVPFAWHSGDVLLVDNAMVLHGRSAFTGRREVYVAMGSI